MTNRLLRNTVETLTLAAVLVIASFVVISPAHAQEEPFLSVTIDTVTRGEPGSIHLLGSRESGALANMECDVVAIGDNNSSVHPGNSLIVTTTTGDVITDAVVLFDYERAEGAVTEGGSRLTIGETLSLSVRLGNDIGPNGLVTSSGGATVQLVACTTPPPPPPTTVVTTTTTTPATTTTTVAKPCVDNPATADNECTTLPRTGGPSTGLWAGVFAVLAGAAFLAAVHRTRTGRSS